jgi:hypothetical protein
LRDYFNIASVETSGWKFAGEISTNGHTVLLTVSTPLRKDRKKGTNPTIDLSQRDSRNIWGLIFGEHNLVAATNGEGQVIRYSKRCFYQNSQIYKTNRKIMRWKNNTRYGENATTHQVESRIPTKRVVSSPAFLDRVEYISQCSDRMFKFFLFEKPFRKLHRSICAHRTLCEIAQMFVRDNQPVSIAVGYTENEGKYIRGRRAHFVAMLERHSTVTVHFIDDYRTRDLCHTCHHFLV